MVVELFVDENEQVALGMFVAELLDNSVRQIAGQSLRCSAPVPSFGACTCDSGLTLSSHFICGAARGTVLNFDLTTQLFSS